MGRVKEGFGSVLRESWRVFTNSSRAVLLTMILDVFFFITLGFVTAPLFERILAYVQAIAAVMGKNAPQLVQAAAKGEGTVALPGTELYLWKLALVYLVLFIVVYIVYSFIEGLAWRNISAAFVPQKDFASYLVPFFRFSLPWTVLFSMYHLFTLYLDFRVLVAAQGNPYPAALMALRYVALLFVSYFMIVSYGVLPWKNTLAGAVRFAWQNFRNFAPVYAFILAVFVGLHFLLIGAFSLGRNMGIFTGIVLVLPWLTFARVMVMEKCRQLLGGHS